MSLDTIIFFIIGFTFSSCILNGYLREKRIFNNGKCMRCNNELEKFTTDSQGGRGYICRRCNFHTWVSYPIIDKKFRKLKNK